MAYASVGGKAVELLMWFTRFLESRITFPEMDLRAARVLGEIAATPAMKHFFVTEDRKNRNGDPIKIDRIRLGGDAMLAALSISHQIPIVTLNIKDFLYIHQLFPIPGLYSPKVDQWSIEPPVGWGFCDGSNDDDIDQRSDWIRNGAPRP